MPDLSFDEERITQLAQLFVLDPGEERCEKEPCSTPACALVTIGTYEDDGAEGDMRLAFCGLHTLAFVAELLASPDVTGAPPHLRALPSRITWSTRS